MAGWPSRWSAKGRLPEAARSTLKCARCLGELLRPLRGRRVVVTAGGTHEPLDPVRYIGNRCFGRMGYALAAAARDLGANVLVISGNSLRSPPAIELIRIETALEMRDAVQLAIDGADLLIMNAAVADFRPAELSERKIKKGDDEELLVRLVRNPDILAGLAARRDLIKVGFAAETHKSARSMRTRSSSDKGLDLIIANEAVASIGSEEIQVTLLDGETVQQLPRQPSARAAMIIAEVSAALAGATGAKRSKGHHDKRYVLIIGGWR